MDIFKSISIASPGTKRAKTELRNISQTDFDNFFKNELPTLKTQSGAQGILTVITRPESPTHKFAKVLLENEEKQHDFFKAISIQAYSFGTKSNGLFRTLICKQLDRSKLVASPKVRQIMTRKIMAFLKAQKDNDIGRDDTDVADEDKSARRMKNKSIFAKLNSKRLSNILKVFMALVLYDYICMLDEQAGKEEAERKRKLDEESRQKQEAQRKKQQEREELEKRKKAEEQKQKEKEEAEEKRRAARDRKWEEELAQDKKQQEEQDAKHAAILAHVDQVIAEGKKQLEEEIKDLQTKKAMLPGLYAQWLNERRKEINAITLPREVTNETVEQFFKTIGELRTTLTSRKNIYFDDYGSHTFENDDSRALMDALNAKAKEKILELLKSYMKTHIDPMVNELREINAAEGEAVLKFKPEDVEQQCQDLLRARFKVKKVFISAITVWDLENDIDQELKYADDERETAQRNFREKYANAHYDETLREKAKREAEEQKLRNEEKARQEEEKRNRERADFISKARNMVKMRINLKDTALKVINLSKILNDYHKAKIDFLKSLPNNVGKNKIYKDTLNKPNFVHPQIFNFIQIYRDENGLDYVSEYDIFHSSADYKQFWESNKTNASFTLADDDGHPNYYPTYKQKQSADSLYSLYESSQKNKANIDVLISKEIERVTAVTEFLTKNIGKPGCLSELEQLYNKILSESPDRSHTNDLHWDVYSILEVVKISSDVKFSSLLELFKDAKKDQREWLQYFYHAAKDTSGAYWLPYDIPSADYLSTSLKDSTKANAFHSLYKSINDLYNKQGNTASVIEQLKKKKEELEAIKTRSSSPINTLVDTLTEFIDHKIAYLSKGQGKGG